MTKACEPTASASISLADFGREDGIWCMTPLLWPHLRHDSVLSLLDAYWRWWFFGVRAYPNGMRLRSVLGHIPFVHFRYNFLEPASEDFVLNPFHQLSPKSSHLGIGQTLGQLGEPIRVGHAVGVINGRRSAGLDLCTRPKEIEQRGLDDADGMYKVAQSYAVLESLINNAGTRKAALEETGSDGNVGQCEESCWWPPQ
jgi:hypothetical protein